MITSRNVPIKEKKLCHVTPGFFLLITNKLVSANSKCLNETFGKKLHKLLRDSRAISIPLIPKRKRALGTRLQRYIVLMLLRLTLNMFFSERFN